MADDDLPSVLCVDDEPNVLSGLKRQLRKQYDVTTACGPEEGLKAIQGERTFTVVMSDLRMPGMDGTAFLSKCREIAPDTVRMLLTGNADVEAAIAAVNRGHLFRFLTKPCPPETLLAAFVAAVEQHRLITAERELLEQTLRGSVQVLTDILSLTNPLAFGRAVRTKRRVAETAEAMGVKERWHLEVAAMLSQIGGVTLPTATAEKVYHGRELSTEEQRMVKRLPSVAVRLTGRIPRLEPVREILRWQNERYDGKDAAEGAPKGEELPLGARLLKAAGDYDVLEARGTPSAQALADMRRQRGVYDPTVLDALARAVGQAQRIAVELTVRQLREGMVFAEDVMAESGMLLIARGQEVTGSLLERIQGLSRMVEVKEPVKVYTEG